MHTQMVLLSRSGVLTCKSAFLPSFYIWYIVGTQIFVE